MDCIIKVIKLLHDMPEANTNRFTIYHPHHKKKLKITLTKFAHNLFFLTIAQAIIINQNT